MMFVQSMICQISIKNSLKKVFTLTLIWVDGWGGKWGGVGWGGGNFTPSPCWFFLNNSETVKAETLAFCSIQLHLIRDVRAKFGIPYLPQSPDIGQNSDGGISDFQISSQSLIKRNCHNSWTSDDIGMKLGPETKLDKRNERQFFAKMLTSAKLIWPWY